MGELPEPPAIVVEASNPACGDTLRLSVIFENGQIARACYKVRGCPAAIAAGSALTELLSGRKADELEDIGEAQIERATGGLPPESRHAASLCVQALNELRKRR